MSTIHPKPHPMPGTTIIDRLADAARNLAVHATLDDALEAVTRLAVEMLPGCSAAAISRVKGGEIETVAPTSDFVTHGDQLQYDLGEGPCLDALRTQIVRSERVAGDARWPRWGPRAAAELGVESMLCFELYTGNGTHGALNLYSTQPGAFDPSDEPAAAAFAGVAAGAITSARTADQLRSAISNRTVIGQAQGIIMERFKLSSSNAFAVLSRISQDSNTKLVDVAQEVVLTGVLPGARIRQD